MADTLPGSPRWSKERYRIVSQRLSAFSVQYLLIDTFEDEIVSTHALMSAAMAERDRLGPGAALLLNADPLPIHMRPPAAAIKRSA